MCILAKMKPVIVFLSLVTYVIADPVVSNVICPNKLGFRVLDDSLMGDDLCNDNFPCPHGSVCIEIDPITQDKWCCTRQQGQCPDGTIPYMVEKDDASTRQMLICDMFGDDCPKGYVCINYQDPPVNGLCCLASELIDGAPKCDPGTKVVFQPDTHLPANCDAGECGPECKDLGLAYQTCCGPLDCPGVDAGPPTTDATRTTPVPCNSDCYDNGEGTCVYNAHFGYKVCCPVPICPGGVPAHSHPNVPNHYHCGQWFAAQPGLLIPLPDDCEPFVSSCTWLPEWKRKVCCPYL